MVMSNSCQILYIDKYFNSCISTYSYIMLETIWTAEYGSVKADKRNFDFVLILAAPVDKNGMSTTISCH